MSTGSDTGGLPTVSPQSRSKRLDSRHRLLEIAIGLLLAIWSAHLLIHTMRLAVIDPDQWAVKIELRLVLTALGAALGGTLLLLILRLRKRGFVVQAAFISIACVPPALFVAALNNLAFADVTGASSLRATMALLLLSFGYYYWLYFSWSAVVIALAFSFTAAEQEREATKLRSEAQAAHLRALRYQLNPHLLFNTLNSIAELVSENPARAEEVVLGLSEFLRSTLAIDPLNDITLNQELDLQRAYLQIESIRFPDRLTFQLDIPPELRELPVPPLILQPLVENAVKHGVALSHDRTTIHIAARCSNGDAFIKVSNDTKLDATSVWNTRGAGVGMQNVQDRLRQRYGKGYGLTAGFGSGRFTAELRFPRSPWLL